MKPKLSEKELSRELAEYRDRYPNLGNDELFVLWFLRAFVTESESAAASALCGGAGDKGIDAVFIDDASCIVFLVQGKFREKIAARAEHRNDVVGFAQIAVTITAEDAGFERLAKDLSPDAQRKIKDARSRISGRGYSLQMFYVTTGRCSKNLQDEASRIVRSAKAAASFQLFDGKRVLLLLSDYFDGVAPPVPSLDLQLESGGGVRTSGVFSRYDRKTDIESWVFSMTGSALGELFDRAGTRLFARNIRGFLGSTEINRGMEATLAKEPELFWYFNNGVTIICDDAKQESSRGQNVLRVTNPQVINGQQTTRTLARVSQKSNRASVLVRVIRVPRETGTSGNHFETLVSKIVSATNWQNAIRPSDLMSNDRRQIEIERQLRKLNYFYLRKRMTKGEARRVNGTRHLRIVKKEEFAQAVAGCDLDPAVVREGREHLFEEGLYDQIFPNADPHYYLARYWLLRQVTTVARGDRQRVYAKWLVLHLVWSSLAPLCRARSGVEAFSRACERKKAEVVNPLNRAIDTMFADALRFYRSKRGAGKDAVDVSTFFKRRKLPSEFERFWQRRGNPAREKFSRSWASFKGAIEKGGLRV
jgi:hypothetical protein